MPKEWGVSYVSNFSGRKTEPIWIIYDNREQADEYMQHLEKQAARGTISNPQLHVRHVPDWQPETEGRDND